MSEAACARSGSSLCDQFGHCTRRNRSHTQGEGRALFRGGGSRCSRGFHLNTLQNKLWWSKQGLQAAEELPWCLTHGDPIPNNIMVDAMSGHLTELIDRAEAEWLPFAVGLYGLEEVLGEDAAPGRFQYYGNEAALRRDFWTTLAGLGGRGRIHRACSRRKWSTLSCLANWASCCGEASPSITVASTVPLKWAKDDAELPKLELSLSAPSVLASLDGKTRPGGGCWALPLALARRARRFLRSKASMGSKLVVLHRGFSAARSGQAAERR